MNKSVTQTLLERCLGPNSILLHAPHMSTIKYERETSLFLKFEQSYPYEVSLINRFKSISNFNSLSTCQILLRKRDL